MECCIYEKECDRFSVFIIIITQAKKLEAIYERRFPVWNDKRRIGERSTSGSSHLVCRHRVDKDHGEICYKTKAYNATVVYPPTSEIYRIRGKRRESQRCEIRQGRPGHQLS